MAFDLSSYKKKTRSVVVANDGDPLTVEYRPGVFTPNLRKEMAKLGEDDVDALAKYLLSLLAGWDATDGGKAVPLTVDCLNDLGYALLNAIFGAIVDDTRPGSNDPNSPKAALNGSSSTS